MKNKTLVYMMITVAVALLVLSIVLISSTTQKENSQDIISATFFPIKEIASNVVGDKYAVVSIIPSGVEPHDYDPTPKDIINLQNSQALFGFGLEFSNIEEELVETNPKIRYVILVESLNLIEGTGEDEHEEDPNEDENEEEHDELGVDPHVWLSIRNMILMTEVIRDEMVKLDPSNVDYYYNNAESYISDLKALDNEYSQTLANCETRTMFTSHAAFAYLAKDYNLEQHSISGLSPEAEPSPEKLRELVDLAREEKVRYIFYEEFVDPRVTETIAKEVGAQTLELNPAEGSIKGESYLEIMEDNLENLKIALSC